MNIRIIHSDPDDELTTKIVNPSLREFHGRHFSHLSTDHVSSFGQHGADGFVDAKKTGGFLGQYARPTAACDSGGMIGVLIYVHHDGDVLLFCWVVVSGDGVGVL